MEHFLAVCIGIGLAAACGFRVFVPLLALSLAARGGHLTLAEEFAWVGSAPALYAFALATLLEVAGYYVPWVDHVLDALASPAAVVAGTFVTAAVLVDMDPFLQWSLALIAGGGVAGLVQGGTVATRLFSTSTSGGLANPLVASAELGFSSVLSFLSLVLPMVALGLVLLLFLWVANRIRRRSRTAKSQPAPQGHA